jgi:hypothetical protein
VPLNTRTTSTSVHTNAGSIRSALVTVRIVLELLFLWYTTLQGRIKFFVLGCDASHFDGINNVSESLSREDGNITDQNVEAYGENLPMRLLQLQEKNSEKCESGYP